MYMGLFFDALGLARKDGAIQPLFCVRGNCNGSVVFVSYEEYVRHLKSAHSTSWYRVSVELVELVINIRMRLYKA